MCHLFDILNTHKSADVNQDSGSEGSTTSSSDGGSCSSYRNSSNGSSKSFMKLPEGELLMEVGISLNFMLVFVKIMLQLQMYTNLNPITYTWLNIKAQNLCNLQSFNNMTPS